MNIKFYLFLLFIGCNFQNLAAQKIKFQPEAEKQRINELFENFNTSAANADFQKYFECFAEESTFIGTDATEIWNKKEFMIWAKPHFDKKKTWDFKSLKRNIFFSKDGKYAWFDELLDTQMKICRGSGILEKINGNWKVKQYILSMTIPNDVSDEVVKIKSPIEEGLILNLKEK